MPGVALIGSGSAVPNPILSNHHLTQMVETSDEWVVTRTGIRERRVADSQTSLVDLAVPAARAALTMAGIAPEDLDLIILATSSADDLFGSACRVQAALGANRAVAFDLTAACSGFVFGLATACQFLRTGAYQRVLLIGADILSRWVDWHDRGTCILFGDGAGAVVLQAQAQDQVLGIELGSDGRLNACLNLTYQAQPQTLVPGLVVAQGTYRPIHMDGQEVYRFAVRQVPLTIEKMLFRHSLTPDQVDWLLLHQANQRILNAVAQRLGIPAHKVISNLEHYGNTSAASIPLALDEAVRQGQVQPGQVVVTAGFGAGLTWGAAVFRWGV